MKKTVINYQFKKGETRLISEVKEHELKPGIWWEWLRADIGTVKITKNVDIRVITKISE